MKGTQSSGFSESATMDTKYRPLNEDYSPYDHRSSFGTKVVGVCICTVFLCSMLLNVFFITGSYHGEMTKNMNPASNPPIIEAYKKEFGLQEPANPQAAFAEALNLRDYDDGNTKSNTLWWIATRQCCGSRSFTDARCNDVPNDPYGGLGCNGCGIQDCRLCGEGPYIPCK